MELSCRDMALPAETHMGPVHLTVSDLERSLDYYRRVVGIEVLEQGAGRASLGADSTELLGLVEEPGAQPTDGYTGLYHFALLVPDRPALAGWLAHAVRNRVPLTGLSDHYVSEAIYLRDPDRHGIEIYADRPRDLWEGRVGERMTTEPLDVKDLLGANTWESAGAPPAPVGSAALRHATVVLPSAETRDEVLRRVADAGQELEETATGTLVRDPSGNAVLLTATSEPASAQTQ